MLATGTVRLSRRKLRSSSEVGSPQEVRSWSRPFGETSHCLKVSSGLLYNYLHSHNIHEHLISDHKQFPQKTSTVIKPFMLRAEMAVGCTKPILNCDHDEIVHESIKETLKHTNSRGIINVRLPAQNKAWVETERVARAISKGRKKPSRNAL